MITYSLDNDNYNMNIYKKMAHFHVLEVCHHYIFLCYLP